MEFWRAERASGAKLRFDRGPLCTEGAVERKEEKWRMNTDVRKEREEEYIAGWLTFLIMRLILKMYKIPYTQYSM